MILKSGNLSLQKLFKRLITLSDGRSMICLLTLALLILSACSGSRTSRILYVNQDSPGGGDGTSWETAFTNPRQALKAAVSGDEVWVAAGIYGPAEPDGREVLSLVNGVLVLGGFGGFESLSIERNTAQYITVLDGQGTSYHVVLGADGALLDGFTITGGNADGNEVQSRYGGTFSGGGVFIVGVSLEIRNCLFTGNVALAGGGAIYNEQASTLIENCIFSYNKANFGGAVENRDSKTRIINSVLKFNESSLSGGAVADFDGTPELINAVISGNIARYVGGGFLGNGGDVVITNCSFTGNRADNTGGAIGLWEGRGRVTNCIFWDNRSGDGSEIHDVNTDVAVRYSLVRGGYTGTGNLETSPGFVQSGTWMADGQWMEGDYRLGPSSAAVDSGTSAGAPDYDVEYNRRPRALAHDMGAYERAEDREMERGR
jgi:predicted outer membrane repeat protein